MKTITAANANRNFFNLLREVNKGEEVMILSRGTPVAKITSIKAEAVRKKSMKSILLARLKAQRVTRERTWIRNELYDD